MPGPVVITTGRGCVSPPGLMNANLFGSISLYCISGHVWPLQPSSLTRGRPPHPPRPLLPRPKPRWRRGAKPLDGADVRCEGSSRIFCKIHYRAFASPTAPKNRFGPCTRASKMQSGLSRNSWIITPIVAFTVRSATSLPVTCSQASKKRFTTKVIESLKESEKIAEKFVHTRLS